MKKRKPAEEARALRRWLEEGKRIEPEAPEVRSLEEAFESD